MKTIGMIVSLAMFPLALLSQTVVSADKMNVLYRGLANPVSIAVAEYPASALQVSVTGASITSEGEGRYSVIPGSENTAVITVVVKDKEGKTVSQSETSFRVLPVPMPITYFAGKNGGTITKAEIKANPVISVRLDDFLFEGISYQVSGCALVYTRGKAAVREVITGNTISGSLLENLLALKSGSKIYLDEIKAKGPDGREILLPAISLTME